jgi:hypothetical protein
MNKPNRGSTIDRRITQVASIIGADKARVDEIAETIRTLDSKRRADTIASPWPPRPLSKRDKTIARSLGHALNRLEKHLNRANIKGVLLRAVHGEQIQFFEWQTQLKHWRECFEAFGGVAKTDRVTLFPDTTTWPLGHRNRSSRLKRKHSAAAAAAKILENHGLRPTATQRTDTRKASIFCRVAAVLYGDPRADLYHQCRVFIETRKRASK